MPYDVCTENVEDMISVPQVQPGHERAKLIIGGWHIKPLSSNECGVHWVSVCDMGLGIVPNAMLALGAPYRNKQILLMIKRMKESCQVIK